ncbi:Oidioi.mRNA.OKI2018_I69.XSR.g13321.t1.cds [Oikopleura dioica]|uniref:Oidioi.mRNA.OKI2018_I69.XSR.g13321.t1.cds n=1 Tax=Oikopleura dioica TaxID=34765 RepID=A0ABN7S6I4_OIKDI|nr:Oidioi.mRNA.OKI2018_I69.XSR.g13321.t1.cds [Oikopleura dioica]
MVTELRDVSNLLQNLEIGNARVEDSKCSKCKGDFRHPLEMPCRHILCFPCVVACCTKAYAENIVCPSCHSKVTFPLGSIKNLPPILDTRQQRLSPEEIDAILKQASQRVNPRRVIELDGSFVEDESFEVIDDDNSDSEDGDSIAILSGSSFEEEEPEESETKTKTTTETETESRVLSDLSEASSYEQP